VIRRRTVVVIKNGVRAVVNSGFGDSPELRGLALLEPKLIARLQQR
jgi:hypothetical protein